VGARAAGVLGAVLVLASIPGASSSAQTAGDELVGYDAVASGTALTVFPSVPALLPVEVPAEATAALAIATLSSGGQGFGRASIFFPGTPIVGVRALVEIAAGTRLPIPDYPLVVESREFEPAKHSELPGIAMVTDVDPDRSSAIADAGALVLPAVLGIRSMHTESLSTLEAGQVTATSTTTLSGIDILGAINIGTLVSTSSVTSDGTTSTCSGGVTVSGVTVSGTKAIIDENGLRLDGQPLVPGLGLGPVVDQLMRATGFDIRVLGGIDSCEGSTGSRSTAGLLVSMPLGEIAAIPAGGGLNLVLGSTSASAGASILPGIDVPLPAETPTFSDILPFVLGPGSGGGLLDPVSTPGPGGPGTVELPTDEVAYAFGGIPWMTLVGFALLTIPLSVRVRRYMDRILALAGQ
jgi:hypothetical protein